MSEEFVALILVRPARTRRVAGKGLVKEPERAVRFLRLDDRAVEVTRYDGDGAEGDVYTMPRDVAAMYWRWLTKNGYKLTSKYRPAAPVVALVQPAKAAKSADKEKT